MRDLSRGFNSPFGVAVHQGRLFIADLGHGKVQTMTYCGLLGCPGGGSGLASGTSTIGSGFQQPWGVSTDSAGNLFVTDAGNHTVWEITAAGGYTTSTTLGSGYFVSPYGVAVDGKTETCTSRMFRTA